MSSGLAVSQRTPRKVHDGQFVADLAGLFERRRIGLGEPHVCEQFEILLTTSDAFRSQLFTLCTAISHMSEHDLSGEELLGLIARALRTESGDGASLPALLRQNFLSGLDAWNNRGLEGEDEWPPVKKPVAAATVAPAVADSLQEKPSAPPRPSGVPTLQEALEKARIRGGNRPLRPELVQPASTPMPVETDTNANAIQELNALLGEIEERMKRLRPQLAETPPVAETVTARSHVLDIFQDESPVIAAPTPAPLPSHEEREAAFLARHPYLDPKRQRTAPVIDAILPDPVEAEEITPLPVSYQPVPQQELQLVPVRPQVSPELRLTPRTVELAPVEEKLKPGPPTLVIPDTMRMKTYLAIAVLAGIVLVGAPISAVVAYRYMHPLYIYDQVKPQPDPAATPPPSAAPDNSSGSGTQGRRSNRKTPAKRKPPVAVWPPQPQQ